MRASAISFSELARMESSYSAIDHDSCNPCLGHQSFEK